MEAHMEMLMHSERGADDRMVIHHHMNDQEREEPVDLIGSDQLSERDQVFGQPTLADHLLQQL